MDFACKGEPTALTRNSQLEPATPIGMRDMSDCEAPSKACVPSSSSAVEPPPLASGGWVIVKGLPLCVMETEVRSIFGIVGPLAQIFFKLEERSQRFKGEVHVEYRDFDHAKEAFARFSGALILGKECSVYLTRASLAEAPKGCRCIGINNLPPSTSRPRLRDQLSIYGAVRFAEIHRGGAETLGYVMFHSPSSALNAVLDLHRRAFFDWPVAAHFHHGSIPDSAQIHRALRGAPEAKELNHATFLYGEVRGRGFVRFYEHGAAEQALLEINGRRNNKGDRRPHRPFKAPVARSRLLLVANLPPTTIYRNLFQLFSPFGTIVSYRLDGGQAWISYIDLEPAANAQRELDGFLLDGQAIRVSFGPQKPASRSSSRPSLGYAQPLDQPTTVFRSPRREELDSNQVSAQACFPRGCTSSSSSPHRVGSDSSLDDDQTFDAANFSVGGLASLDRPQKVRILGEKLFRLVSPANAHAGEVVDHLVASRDVSSLVGLVRSPEKLRREVDATSKFLNLR
ncbi:Polyadenylate-binding protein 4-like [Massospora cicadina]|nr:Polyadenylate-binding protein 4-like [Massospora cicadina]